MRAQRRHAWLTLALSIRRAQHGRRPCSTPGRRATVRAMLWAALVPIVLVLLVTVAVAWIPLSQARNRRRGQTLIDQDAQHGDLAAEVEQMRRGAADETGETGKS